MAVGSLCALYFVWEKPSLGYQITGIKDSQKSSAHLVAKNVLLQNTTMEWNPKGVGDMLVGTGFKEAPEELKVTRSGLYYIYSQMKLRCVDIDECKKTGSVSVTVLINGNKDEPLLELNIQISESSKNVIPTSFSGRLKYLSSGDRLSSHLWTDQEHEDWHLDAKENNFLGLFWVSDISGMGLSH
ncbi:tumor necrosis factor ligand superfamily member 9 [Pelobates cultripes]|uniref:Tumor necrosis factor ligand superfamily member 9 n=1 Tax=Pelobates cultripes TaxID=61616 RepID=A0AAD1VXQ3_PELCU|nr:tumor necrosis factor ligand superfamily member 9 [Pelobates cultripes]